MLTEETRESYEKTDETGLTERQYRVLAALLTHATIRDAAQAAQVSEATIYRYKRDAAFCEALRSAQSVRMQAAVGFLQSGTGEALGALRELMVDKNQAGTVRVAACRAWIGYALRTFYEFNEIDTLLQRLRDEVDDYDNEI